MIHNTKKIFFLNLHTQGNQLVNLSKNIFNVQIEMFYSWKMIMQKLKLIKTFYPKMFIIELYHGRRKN